MELVSNIYSKAITFVEFEKSGNPQEKYKSGSGILASYYSEATKSGVYSSYMDEVVCDTTLRFDELKQEIEYYSRATCKLSLEHSNPEAYLKMRLLELLDER